MKIESQYSRNFHSDMLSRRKYGMVYEHAEKLLNIRNEISGLVNSNLMKYLEMSKIDFQKDILPLIKERVHSNFTKQLCDDVYTMYQNRFVVVKDKMRFEKVKSIEVTFYKRNTKNKRKGDIKGISRKTESTTLTKSLSYLARYGNENTVNYLSKKLLTEENEDKKKFYATTLDYINRFGYERLLHLAIQKRDQILKRYEEPISFKSLSFRGRSRLSSNIVSYNRNFESVIKAFINVSWIETRTSLKIPVLYSKKFHGEMKKYTNGTDTSYTVCMDKKNKSLRFVLSHEGDREYPEATADDKFVGFDANSKHNQLIGSNGLTVDYDRKLVNDLIQELLHVDKLKEKNKEYKQGKKISVKIDTLRRKVKHHTERNCVTICKHMIQTGDTHAVFENLNNSFGRCFATDENEVNYNRIMKELHLSSIKDVFERIARKYNIPTSFIHPEYTSIQCSECGCIDEENRKTQEKFECIECGHSENADSNAAKNILRRVSEAVLRDTLLKANKLGNGSYSPKTLKRYKVKEMLLSLRYTVYNQKPRELTNSTPLVDFGRF